MPRGREYFIERLSRQGECIIQGQYWLKPGARALRRDLCLKTEVERTPAGSTRSKKAQLAYLQGLYNAKKKELEAERETTPRGTPISKVMQTWLDEVAELRNPETAKAYAQSVTLYISACGDHAIEQYKHAYNVTLAAYLKALPNVRGGPYSVASQRKHFRHLQGFFHWAYQRQFLAQPVWLTSPEAQKKEIDVYSTEEVLQLGQHILAVAQAETKPDRRRNRFNDYRAFKLAVHTLLREGAIWALRLENIDLPRGVIRIRHNPELGWKNKKGKEVNKPINEALLPFLQADLAARSDAERYFLDNGQGGPGYKSPAEISRAFRRYRDQLGLSQYKPFHALRGWGITYLLNHGVDIKAVKELADHESIITTEAYAPSRRLLVDSAAAKLDFKTNELPTVF